MLFYQPGIKEGVQYLDPDESRHCVKVLRHKRGDSIRITDGRGSFYDAVITSPDSTQCGFDIRSERRAPAPDFTVHIAIAPTKHNERIDWFVEKVVEIGVAAITFTVCERSERSVVKMDRLARVAVSAMKQSLRATLPAIRGMIPFAEFVQNAKEEQRFIAVAGAAQHLARVSTAKGTYCVLVGPEGDFSMQEVQMAEAAGFLPVNLGSARLRTETAGLAAVHSLSLVNL